MKLWKIIGADPKVIYETHAETKAEAIVNFIDAELGLRLSNYQFNDAMIRIIDGGKFCMLNDMLQVTEVIE